MPDEKNNLYRRTFEFGDNLDRLKFKTWKHLLVHVKPQQDVFNNLEEVKERSWVRFTKELTTKS